MKGRPIFEMDGATRVTVQAGGTFTHRGPGATQEAQEHRAANEYIRAYFDELERQRQAKYAAMAEFFPGLFRIGISIR